ncbi:MAG: hypothetical protein J7L82_03100 [Staphylothermus sp.]|nr:hypothetical protein [Staphylothermus sp.]
MRICIEEQNLQKITRMYSASIIGGCEPEIGCENSDFNIYYVKDTITIDSNGLKENVSWNNNNNKDISIRLNKKLDKR